MGNAALSLNPGQIGVDDRATVHGGLIVEHLDGSGGLVDLHFHHTSHIGGRGDRGGGGGSELGLKLIVDHGSGGHVHQGDTALRVADTADRLAVKLRVLHVTLHQSSTDLLDALPQLLTGFFHSAPGEVGGGGGIGAGVIGGGIGVGTVDHHVVHVTLHNLGGHLSQDGVTSGAHVSGTNGQGIEAVIVELDGSAANVHIRNAGPLHGQSHAHAAHLAVAHIPAGIFLVPTHALGSFLQAAV